MDRIRLKTNNNIKLKHYIRTFRQNGIATDIHHPNFQLVNVIGFHLQWTSIYICTNTLTHLKLKPANEHVNGKLFG